MEKLSKEQEPAVVPDDNAARLDGGAVEEFSIIELEDRLEFVTRSDDNCGCPPPPQL
jgi:hypothetical protein